MLDPLDAPAPARITIVAGGVGGSRFTRGVRAAYPEATLTVVVNTADDIALHGLHISPDLDTMMYALGGGIDPERGWGRADESFRAVEELRAYGAEPSWFGLGDRDLATHLVRTARLAAGAPLSSVTAELCRRWLPAAEDPRLLPMTDDSVQTHVRTAEHGWVHFQEYWVRLRAGPDALEVAYRGIEDATPGPGVLEAVATADLLLLAPSNPVVSVGPVLAVPGLRDAVRSTAATVIGFAGILRGAPVLGMAHRLLPAIGVATDAAAVGLHYGARSADGVLDAWLMGRGDHHGLAALEAAGLRADTTDLIMSDELATAEFVRHGVKVARG